MYVWSLHVTSYSNTSNSNMNHKQSVSFLLVGSQILRMFSSHLNWSTGLCPWTVPYWAYRFSRTPSPTRSFPMCCYASNFSPNLQMTLFMILHFGHFERSIFHIRKKKKQAPLVEHWILKFKWLEMLSNSPWSKFLMEVTDASRDAGSWWPGGSGERSLNEK